MLYKRQGFSQSVKDYNEPGELEGQQYGSERRRCTDSI